VRECVKKSSSFITSMDSRSSGVALAVETVEALAPLTPDAFDADEEEETS
jgi:hypothetical protein